MDEKEAKIRGNAISDEELTDVVGGAQTVELARCAGCGRSGVAAAMYTLRGEKYCSACYREALRS